MHVGYDAWIAECHHHILGYLKIDPTAWVRVRAPILLLCTGPWDVYYPIHFVLALSFLSHAAAPLVQWCSTRHPSCWTVCAFCYMCIRSHTCPPMHGRTCIHTHCGGYAILQRTQWVLAEVHCSWSCHTIGCSEGQVTSRCVEECNNLPGPLAGSFIKPVSTGDDSFGLFWFSIHRHRHEDSLQCLKKWLYLFMSKPHTCLFLLGFNAIDQKWTKNDNCLKKRFGVVCLYQVCKS